MGNYEVAEMATENAVPCMIWYLHAVYFNTTWNAV